MNLIVDIYIILGLLKENWEFMWLMFVEFDRGVSYFFLECKRVEFIYFYVWICSIW